jgi:Phage portal protein, SPP1 Gp6-like
MNFIDKQFAKLGDYIAGRITSDKERRDNILRDYYDGDHPDQLKVKSGAYDDNFTMNYIGLAISRGVSRLFNNGIEFKLPDESQKEYLDQIWDANKQEQLLYQLGLNGAVYGTPFLKIVPDGIVNRKTGQLTYRLIALDPEITRVEVNPFDVDEPEKYIIEFSIKEEGNVKSYKEVTRQAKEDDFEDPENSADSWIVEHWIMTKQTGDKWQLDPANPPYQWPYDFPPIIHWKNLPSLKSSHGWRGSTDAEWAIGVQNKLNFADSNINKTIRLNSAPPTIVTGVNEQPTMGTGPGSLSWFSNPETKAYNLQANADIPGSMAYADSLESGIFELMREVPPAVIKTLGSGLTNFVMRVLFSDAIDKTDTKRELYGDAILEINRRLLVLAGNENADPGLIEWGSALPENPQEQIETDTFLLDKGLVSKKTIAAKYDVDYDAEQAQIDIEATKKNATGGNLLRDFIAGRGQNVNQG